MAGSESEQRYPQRCFKKCGISLDLSGSENNKINMEGIPDYKMPSADEVLDVDVEFHLESDDSHNDIYDDDCDEFKAESQIIQ